MPTSRGFTLIELLVVMAIIGVLSSVILVAGEEAREQGRNAERTAVVLQYKSAVELSYDAGNAYPVTENGDEQGMCIGTYPDGTCFGTTAESNRINAAVAPFIQGKQTYPDTNLQYNGVVYQSRDSQGDDHTYELWWFLEGKNRTCSGGLLVDGNFNGLGNTFCHYIGGQ